MTDDKYQVAHTLADLSFVILSSVIRASIWRVRYSEPRIAARFRFISATRELWSWPRRVTTLVAKISIKVSAANREMVGV